MKLHNASLVALLLLATAGGAQAQKTMGPQLTAEKTIVDFGEVNPNNDTGIRTYTFTNTGTEPLLITEAHGSCGCTIPQKPEAPIRPGEKGEMKIRYDITRKGPIQRTVTFTTNEVVSSDANGAPVYKTYTLEVKGLVKDAPTANNTPLREPGSAPME